MLPDPELTAPPGAGQLVWKVTAIPIPMFNLKSKSLNIIYLIDFEFKGSLKAAVSTHDVCNENACWTCPGH